MNSKQSNAINEIKADAKKLNDRELLEEIYNNQIDENFHSGEIKKQIYLSTIMIAVVLSIVLIEFYK